MAKGLQDLADIAFRPEDDPVFRQAQLLLLLDELRSEPTSLDRLTYYDFFAESPYLLFTEEDPERRTLRLAGFQSAALSYHSPAQRFVTRQEQVGGDLAALVAYRLADASHQPLSGIRYNGLRLEALPAAPSNVFRRVPNFSPACLQAIAKTLKQAPA